MAVKGHAPLARISSRQGAARRRRRCGCKLESTDCGAARDSRAAAGSAASAAAEGHALDNYRLPGTRELVLADARVHLIHGPNGSGKSSIVEALELVATGKVDRLEQAQEKQYHAVIRNRALGAEATIT